MKLNPIKKSSTNLVLKKFPSRTTKAMNSCNTDDVLSSTTVLQPKWSPKICYLFLLSTQSPENPRATNKMLSVQCTSDNNSKSSSFILK